jgi:tRNA-dihydrouridine synthase B
MFSLHIDEPGILTVQIAGSDPEEMADSRLINVKRRPDY